MYKYWKQKILLDFMFNGFSRLSWDISTYNGFSAFNIFKKVDKSWQKLKVEKSWIGAQKAPQFKNVLKSWKR